MTQPLTPNLCSEIRLWALYACLKSTIQRWRSVHFFHLPPVEIADFHSLFRGNRSCEKPELLDCTGSKRQLRTVSKSLFKSAKLFNIHIINESFTNLPSPPMKSHPVMLIIKGSDLNCFLYGYGMFLGLFSYRSGTDGERLCLECCCSPEADTLSCFPPVGLSCCTPPSDCLSSATAS